MTTEGRDPCLHGVLVTYRRPAALERTLEAISAQTVLPKSLVVIDNAPAPGTESAIRSGFAGAEYIAAAENLGPAGGIALGMERILETAGDGDWVVTLDDDDPPTAPTTFSTLLDFAGEMSARDPLIGAVGVSGVRFDRRRGQIVRVPDAELDGAVPVDSIAGNQFPLYAVRAVRAVGPFRRDLFFGFEELEFGLRLRDAGYSLYGHGPMWFARREEEGRLGRDFVPSRALGTLSWRRYYSLRNLVRILCDYGAIAAALRVTVVAGIAKPVANVGRDPWLAMSHLALNIRAVFDGWTRRMGRTVEPGA